MQPLRIPSRVFVDCAYLAFTDSKDFKFRQTKILQGSCFACGCSGTPSSLQRAE